MLSARMLLRTLPLCLALGCGKVAAGPGIDAAGLATVIDSAGDSLIARVAGPVPAAAVRRLTEELRIAPGQEDTTLFTEVYSYKVDRAGRFWVFDQPSKSIFLFGTDGKLIRRLGRDGAGPGEYRQNNGMVARADGGIALWDSQNSRISFLDSAGVFVTSWPTPSGFSTSNGLVSDRSGGLFLKRPVTAPRAGEILGRMGLVRLSPGGTLGDSLAPPDLDVPREMYVAHQKGGTSSTSSQFAPGYDWGWHPDGYFVVAHGGKYEITLAPTGRKPIVIRRETDPVPISSEEQDEEHARIQYQMRMTDPGWNWSGPPIPDRKAPLGGITISRDGRIWARVPVPSERIPDAEMAPSRDPKAPAIHFRTPMAFEVFSPEGKFLGRVEFPARTRLIEADGDLVWALGRDENDLPAVIRFRITPGFR